MIELIVIIGFCYSVLLFFAVTKLYDLRQEMKLLQKKKLNTQFKICHTKGIIKGIEIAQSHLKGNKQ